MEEKKVFVTCKGKNGLKRLFGLYSQGLALNSLPVVADERRKTLDYIFNNTKVSMVFVREIPSNIVRNIWSLVFYNDTIGELYTEINHIIFEEDYCGDTVGIDVKFKSF